MANCRRCREAFTPTRRSHLFCSKSCGRAYRYRQQAPKPEAIPCRVCRKTFTPQHNNNTIYCGARCRNRARTSCKRCKRRATMFPGMEFCSPDCEAPSSQTILGECVCGELFRKIRANHIYCSKRCLDTSKSRDRKSCKVCGKEFRGRGHSRVCSSLCHRKAKERRNQRLPIEDGALPCLVCSQLVPRRSNRGPRPEICEDCRPGRAKDIARAWARRYPEKLRLYSKRHRQLCQWIDTLGVDNTAVSKEDRDVLRDALEQGGRYQRIVAERMTTRARLQPVYEKVKKTKWPRSFWLDLIDVCHHVHAGQPTVTISKTIWASILRRDKDDQAINRGWTRWKTRMRDHGLCQFTKSQEVVGEIDAMIDIRVLVPLADMVLGINEDVSSDV